MPEIILSQLQLPLQWLTKQIIEATVPFADYKHAEQ